jgi:hypothetical protein
MSAVHPRFRLLLSAMVGMVAVLVSFAWLRHEAGQVLHDRALLSDGVICTEERETECLRSVSGYVFGGWDRHDSDDLEWRLGTSHELTFAANFGRRDSEQLEELRGKYVSGWYLEDRPVAIVKSSRVIPTANVRLSWLAWTTLMCAGISVLGVANFLFAGTALLRGHQTTAQSKLAHGPFGRLLLVLGITPLAFGVLSIFGMPATWGVIGSLAVWCAFLCRAAWCAVLGGSATWPLRLPLGRTLVTGAIGVSLLLWAGWLVLMVASTNADRVAVQQPLTCAQGERCLTRVKGQVTECEVVYVRRSSDYYICYFEQESGERSYAEFSLKSQPSLESSDFQSTWAWLSGEKLIAVRALPEGEVVVTRSVGFASLITTSGWSLVLGLAGFVTFALAVEEFRNRKAPRGRRAKLPS